MPDRTSHSPCTKPRRPPHAVTATGPTPPGHDRAQIKRQVVHIVSQYFTKHGFPLPSCRKKQSTDYKARPSTQTSKIFDKIFALCPLAGLDSRIQKRKQAYLMRTPLATPWRYLLLVCSLWFGIFLLTRLVLLATHLDEVHGDYVSMFFSGALYDLSFLTYAALPLGLYLALCPAALWRTRWHRRATCPGPAQALDASARSARPDLRPAPWRHCRAGATGRPKCATGRPTVPPRPGGQRLPTRTGQQRPVPVLCRVP